MNWYLPDIKSINILIVNDNFNLYKVPLFATNSERNMKSKVVKWKQFSIPLSSFGENDKVYVKLEVFEHYKDKAHVLVGEIETTVSNLIENAGRSLKITMNSL